MKITIELDDAEVKGIKDYIRQSEEINNPTKQDIQREVQGVVNGVLQMQHSALADCILKYRQL